MSTDRIVSPARLEHLHEPVGFTAQCAREPRADITALQDIRLAASEVCMNVIEHGYTGEPRGSITLRVFPTVDDAVASFGGR